jgi:hypothetical protein
MFNNPDGQHKAVHMMLCFGFTMQPETLIESTSKKAISRSGEIPLCDKLYDGSHWQRIANRSICIW